MPERYTFDSEAILAFYLGEKGGEVTQSLLEQIKSGEAEGNISIINLTEIYYILARVDPNLPKSIEKKLRLMGLKVIPVEDNDDLWRNAAKIKAKHRLSLADAFAAATAEKQKTTLIIGTDKEFDELNIKTLKIRT